MQFVQIGFLAALAALVIPVVIHLLFKRRSRRVDLGTIRFLQQVIENNARRRRLKRWTLMGLRMLAIGLLALLFARPFLQEPAVSLSGREVVILVDQSATMQLQADGKRLIAQAATQANGILQKEAAATIHAAWFDHTIHKLPRSADQQFVPPDESTGSTNYGVALAWARDLLATSDAEEKALYIITDLQQSGLDWNDVQPMPPEVDVNVTDLGRNVVNNVAIVATESSDTLIRPGLPFEMTCTVSSEAVFPIEQQTVVMTLSRGNKTITDRKTVRLDPGDLINIQFALNRLQPGLWQGSVELVDCADDLPFDNKRHVAVMVDDQIPVLIVDGRMHESQILSSSYFLEAGIRLASRDEEFADSPYLPKVVAADSDFERLLKADNWPIVIFSNVPTLRTSTVKRLSSFVQSGGNLLVFTGEGVQPRSWNALFDAGILPGKLSTGITTFDLPFRLNKWNGKHAIMRLFDDPQHGDVRGLSFRGITPVEPANDAEVVAEFRHGKPALLERAAQKGRCLLFASSCDRQWTEWPRSPLYVPMVHQMLGYLSGLSEGGPIRQSLIGSLDSTSDESATLSNDAENSPVAVPPGIHKRDRYWDVVNTNPRESEMERTSVEEFSNRFGLETESDESESAAVQAAGIDVRQSELWPLFLIALLAVLGLETMLANRTLA